MKQEAKWAPLANPTLITPEERPYWLEKQCEKCDGFGYEDIEKPCPLWDKWGTCSACFDQDCLGQQRVGMQRGVCSVCRGYGKLYQRRSALEQLADCAE